MVSINEKKNVDDQIKNLVNSTVISDEKSFEVMHNLVLTMVDGKVCNALTDTTSTQKCYLCGVTSKEFKSIEKMIQRDVKTDNLEFGLSVLHGWIRFFECLLHIAYKLPLKKWQARGDDKTIVAENKKRIQNEFKEKLGLIVDKPKPGFGNSNDGNTARRFFKNPEVSADITRIDIELIKKMHILLIVVSSGHEIHFNKFREFSHNTARYFVENYPWYNMPPTLHKYFIHGPEIIKYALLPIGNLTEEAQEARNNDFKRYRENNSRKCSREKSNMDIFNFFLLSSDPVISSKRKLCKKKLQSLPKQAINLLDLPAPNVQPLHSNQNDNDESDDNSECDSDDNNSDNTENNSDSDSETD